MLVDLLDGLEAWAVRVRAQAQAVQVSIESGVTHTKAHKSHI